MGAPWNTPLMPWDADRPIPWKRLLREALIFLLLGALIFAFVLHTERASSYVGLVIGAGLFVLISAPLSKFGYLRPTLNRPRSPARAAGRQAVTPGPRPKPAPTRRTGGSGKPRR